VIPRSPGLQALHSGGRIRRTAGTTLAWTTTHPAPTSRHLGQPTALPQTGTARTRASAKQRTRPGNRRVAGTCEPPGELAHARPRRTALTALLTAALLGATALPGLGSPAAATTIEARALAIVASKAGDPYQWGGAGPDRFDCSGLMFYAFRKAGHRLPRTVQSQYTRVRHIPARIRHPGDLVFFHHGRLAYHVGIYAGHGMIWSAPHPGTRVRLDRIWTTAVWYGRIP
jgi:cell wall-associated NlpC family hydrolase